jgi:hypothetical protein
MSEVSQVIKESSNIVNSSNFGIFVIAVALLVSMFMNYQILEGIKTELTKQTEVLRIAIEARK